MGGMGGGLILELLVGRAVQHRLCTLQSLEIILLTKVKFIPAQRSNTKVSIASIKVFGLLCFAEGQYMVILGFPIVFFWELQKVTAHWCFSLLNF